MVSKFVLRPAPVGDPSALMSLHLTHDGEPCCNQFSWPLYTDVRDQAKSFSGVAAYGDLVPASIGGKGEPERVWGQATTSNYFDVAQLGMTLGRGFASDEERLPVIVLSQRLWQRRFASDPAILGKSITLSGRPFTVVGIAPQAFRGVDMARRHRTPESGRLTHAGRSRTQHSRPALRRRLPENRQGWRLPI
jgi:hypothetical protein